MFRVPAVLVLALMLVARAAARSALISLDVHDVELADVLRLLGAAADYSVLTEKTLPRERITLRLHAIEFERALALLTQTYHLRVRRDGSVLIAGAAPGPQTRLPLPAVPAAPATAVVPLRFVKPSEALKTLKGIVPDEAAVADDRQNAVLVTAAPAALALVRRVLANVDVATPQVMFEVRVVDISPSMESSNVGVQWGGYDAKGAPAEAAATYAFTRNSLGLFARINALVTQGRASILATPRLMTLNNREANLLVGQTYPIVYFDIRSGNQQVQYIDIGVKLRVTPTIGNDGSVTAEIHPEFSALAGLVAGGFPIISNRRADATLRVRSGETIVLGGLMQDIDAETVSKVPLLGDLPLFGEIFKNRQKNHQKDEIMFFITPHVVAEGTRS